MKTDVTYLIARYKPFRGGAEQNCANSAAALQRQGLKVKVITTDVSPNPQKLDTQDSIDSVEVHRVHAWNKQLNAGFYPQLLPALLSDKSPIIHVMNGPGFLWRDFCLFCKKLSAPSTKIIITPHGRFLSTPATHTGIKALLAKSLQPLMHIYSKLLWHRLFTAVVAINTAQVEWLTRDYGFSAKAIHVVPNGISAELIERGVSKPALPPIFLTYIGRLEQYKGVHRIIKAMSQLDDNDKARIHFNIIGDGVYRGELHDLVNSLGLEDAVTFYGLAAEDTKWEVLRSKTHIGVLISDWEATGIVLLEAMAVGNTIITSDGNEMAAELTDEGRAGYIVPVEETETLSQMLSHILNSPTELEEKSTAASQIVQQFRLDKVLEEYLRLIMQLRS